MVVSGKTTNFAPVKLNQLKVFKVMSNNDNKLKATIYFDCNGKFIPMLCTDITFTSITGAKRAFNNAIKKMRPTLYNFYPMGSYIKAQAFLQGGNSDKPFITSNFYV